MNPHVLHYLPTLRLSDGGVVRAVLDLADAYAASGRATTVAVHDRGDAPERWTQEQTQGVPRIVEIPAASSLPVGPNAAADAFAELARQADVVHFHGMWDPKAVALGKIAKRVGTPYVVSPHGMLDDWSMTQSALKKRVFSTLLSNAWLSNAAAVICTAQRELEQVRTRLPKPGIGCAVPLVFKTDEYRAPPGPQLARARFELATSDLPKLLFLSRLHYKKGVEHLIDAAGLLAERGSPHALLIAGPGDDSYVAELKQRVTDLGLDGTTAFLGMVSGPDKVSLYEAADMMVLPTSQENYGYVFFESLAAGTPLITTPGVDTSAELASSGAAWIVEQDATRIADEIQKHTGDLEHLASLGRAARTWVLDRMDPAAVCAEFADVYARAKGAHAA
ncbi:MAG: glycosyltransferase [Planctomycetota bacterium]